MAAAGETQNFAYESKDILREVRNFVKGSTYEKKVSSEELAKSALFLLKSLPAARHAVLEHLCNVFDEAVHTHILHIELGSSVSDSTGPNLDNVIKDAQGVLMGFVRTNPSAWAPILSAWSIDLLGQISSKYADRRGVPHSSSLNELLQLWMTCTATKTLMEIASECFASMVGGAPDVCVDALLEASVKHSPHFDWVVAHIGSCFPTTIITRVLMCGLKDFYLHGSSQSELATSSQEKIPKMASVVGILGHLASQHGQNIRKALLTLFEESVQPGADNMQLCTVPFLLHLASMSSMLLKVITTDFVHTLTPVVLNNLVSQFSQWKQDGESLISLVVHLIIKSDDGAMRVLGFLLDMASGQHMVLSGQVNTIILRTCAVIMDKLLLDLQRAVHYRRSEKVELPFLGSLQVHVVALCRQLVRSDHQVSLWLSKLLACIGVYCGESCASEILSAIVMQGNHPHHMSLFLQLQREMELHCPSILETTVNKVVDQLQPHKDNGGGPLQPLRNLLQLVQAEKQGNSSTSVVRCPLCECLQRHTVPLSAHMYSRNIHTATMCAELLQVLGLVAPPSMMLLTRLCCALTTYFFNVLHTTEDAVRRRGGCVSVQFIKELSHFSTAQSMILRFLVEGTLRKENAPLFGSKVDQNLLVPSLESVPPSLMEKNMKCMHMITLPQSKSAVFHAGIIGQGLKPLPRPSPYNREQQYCNKQTLQDALCACGYYQQQTNLTASMDTNSPPTPMAKNITSVSEHVARGLAFLLVEQVSPDVMYNSVVWPEEDFMRVTVERDLQIKKRFEENPVLFDMMDLVAECPTAVLSCSVLLRGLMATLIAHWESSRDKSTTNSIWHLKATCCIMGYIRKGGLLPQPLCYIGEVFHLVSPYEVFLLLLNVWRYIKENPLNREDENKPRECDPQYLSVLQSVLHNNIEKLGPLYARFFRPA